MKEFKIATPKNEEKTMIKMEKQVIIIAPHTDDEIIGCYEVLNKLNPIIIYTDPNIPQSRKEEALKLKESVKIKGQFFLQSIPPHFFTQDFKFYFPDPIYENHPLHRSMGVVGEQMGRSGLDVCFYSVNMLAPYIHEVLNPDKKEDLLNKIYPSQKRLWEYDKKYVLFEGYCKWIFGDCHG